MLFKRSVHARNCNNRKCTDSRFSTIITATLFIKHISGRQEVEKRAIMSETKQFDYSVIKRKMINE